MTTRRDVLAAALAAALASCTRRRSGDAGQAPAAVAHRIVSIAPATTEALFALGAGAQVVGRSRFCDFPPEVARLPAVGGFIDADLELILQLEPDLVVGAPGPSSTRLGEKLAVRGIATWFPSIESIAAIEAMLTGLGERVGHATEAHRLTQDVEDGTGRVERAVAAEPAPTVLMVLGVSPLVAAGPKSFLDELIRRARAMNVVTTGAAWQTLELETVVELDPDVVLDASADGAADSRLDPRAPGWSAIRALRGGSVIPVRDPRVLRPGPRVAQGLSVLAHAIHPQIAMPLL